MIEEFIQNLQQAEVEAKGIIKVARERVQTIQRDVESSLAVVRTSTEVSLQQRLDVIDQETNQHMKLAEDQLRRDLKEQLESLEHLAQNRKPAALDLLLSRLTAR